MDRTMSKRRIAALIRHSPWIDMSDELVPPTRPLSELTDAVKRYREAVERIQKAKVEHAETILRLGDATRAGHTPADRDARIKAATDKVERCFSAAFEIQDEITRIAIHCTFR
jgi:hypothetical protein